MAFILRIISFLLILGFFMVVVFSSFLSEPKTVAYPDFMEVFNEFSSEESLSGATFEKKSLSLFESVFYSGAVVEIEKQESNYDMQISGTGMILSSLRDITQTYSIRGDGFRIIQEGIGEIYIDMYSVPGKILVFPLNTSLKLELMNETGTEVYSSIYLTPHMFLSFDPTRGKFLKNADVLRIQTVYELGYLGASVQNIFTNNFFIAYNDNIEGFFTDVLGHIKKRDTKLQAQIHALEDQDIYKLPGIESIERYSNFFVNDEKKKVFYQNQILEGYLTILQSESFQQSDILEVEKDLQKLSQIDTVAYDFMISMGYQINAALNTSYEKNHTVAKISFAKLLSTDLDEKKWYFGMYGFSLYSLYDVKNIFSIDMSEKYLQSFKDFQDREAVDKNEHTVRSQYFSFFLEKQLLYSFQSEKNSTTIDSIIDTFQKYLEISKVSYETTNVMKITRLYIYAEILENIDIFLRTGYFVLERNEENLLRPHPVNKLSSSNVLEFQNQTQKIFQLYEDTKIFLNPQSPRDNDIQKDILLSKRRMDEYFLALSNYTGYQEKYDISKQDLLNVDILNEDEDLSLSSQKAREFLSGFIGLEMSGAQIEIQDNYYYSISNVFIGGKRFSFDLYPYLSYNIQNIVIDGDEIKFTYKLSLKEIEWDELYERAPLDEKENYDFSKFFIITFIQNPIINNVENYIPNDIQYNEDSTEIVFKRDILLGSAGEFRNIKQVLPLKYENIRITKNTESYDIFIENADLIFEKTEELKNDYSGLFQSQYILNDIEHAFRNISFKLIKTQDNTRVALLGSGDIYVMGKVNIENFNTVMQDIRKNIEVYEILYELIEKKYPINILTLQYNPVIQKMTFKFDSAGKTYSILLREDMIEKIYIGSVNTLTTPTLINQIEVLLP